MRNSTDRSVNESSMGDSEQLPEPEDGATEPISTVVPSELAVISSEKEQLQSEEAVNLQLTGDLVKDTHM